MTQRYTLAQISARIQAKLVGNPDIFIEGVAPIANAKTGYLCFLENSKYRKYLSDTVASAVILAEKDVSFCKTNALVTDNPHLAYAKVAELFAQNTEQMAGIHSSVVVGEGTELDPSCAIGPLVVIGRDCKIGANVQIGAGCVIGDGCEIGANTRLYPRVTLYHVVTIGQSCLLHSGAVIGADGFGYAQSPQGWYKVPQLGGVVIGNQVEIGANTSIDRGAIEPTVIEDGVKLDNQIQIGHNVHIGAHTAIAGCVGIAGSVRIGKFCMIAGGVGIANHVEIADRVIITAMTGVSKSILVPGIYSSGFRAEKHEAWQRNTVHFQHLDDYFKRLQKLEKQSSSKEKD